LERICLLAAALGLLHEGYVTDVIGVALFVLVIVIQKISVVRAKKSAAQIDIGKPIS
jgi:UPF0716 family protein affecting phage T7 exclusion